MATPEKDNEPVTRAVGKPSMGASTWLFISRHQPALFLNGETIPLSGDREYIIGRDPDTCSIVINDERVSRKHAAIYARGGRYFIKDFGSVNGTMVNREKIGSPIGLLPGDEICVSTQKLLFVLHDQVLSSSTGPAAQKQSHFSGLLRSLRIPDLIQLLYGTQQTGLLTIEDLDGEPGRAYFASGEIISAHYRNKADEEAVYALVTIKDGHFEFLNENAPPPTKTIRSRTMPLLLEACRRADEGIADICSDSEKHVAAAG
jgi:pSer/pThr/pTyr-binding forkhead associated (FHA) protein